MTRLTPSHSSLLPHTAAGLTGPCLFLTHASMCAHASDLLNLLCILPGTFFLDLHMTGSLNVSNLGSNGTLSESLPCVFSLPKSSSIPARTPNHLTVLYYHSTLECLKLPSLFFASSYLGKVPVCYV